jgi:glycolate oxidase FAD binding subunit
MPVRNSEALAWAAINTFGSDIARPATDADRIGDCRPHVVLEPRDAQTTAAMLRWADTERLSIGPRGGGTKLKWGQAPSRLDVILSTRRLNAPVDHCAGDLTATVPAGASLDLVNAVLRLETQWLPLDPAASDRATIGGILATGDSGPRRHRFGTPRDLVIGIEMALVDGRTAKAGGRVVKNVAGYDLSRLLCGSFGCLAVITSATFKLAPLATASQTLVATLGDAPSAADLALAIAAAPLNPSAIELEAPPYRLLVRFESTPGAAEREAAAALELCVRHGGETTVMTGSEESAVWRAHELRVWDSPATLVKITTLPTDLVSVLERVASLAADHGLEYRLSGRAALGVTFLRLSGDADAQSAMLGELGSDVAARRGYVVVLAAPTRVRAVIDPWGRAGDGLAVMRAVKARFDPNNTLNPGRGPGGL